MTSYTGVVRSKHATLVANTADLVTFAAGNTTVLVQNRSTSGYLFARPGATAPTVAGDDCYAIGPGQSAMFETNGSVGVICATANDYSVTAV